MTEKPVSRFLEALGKHGLTVRQLQIRETPFLFVSWPREPIEELYDALLMLTFDLHGMTGCRAVSVDRLRYITTHGCDVHPTTAPVYVNFLDKALEYGEWPKVLQIFDARKLEHTYVEVPADTAPDELAELSRTFPTRVPSLDGQTLWLSRLSANDPRLAKPYEADYARWIPGDPWKALSACVVLVSDSAGWSRIAEMFSPPSADAEG